MVNVAGERGLPCGKEFGKHDLYQIIDVKRIEKRHMVQADPLNIEVVTAPRTGDRLKHDQLLNEAKSGAP